MNLKVAGTKWDSGITWAESGCQKGNWKYPEHPVIHVGQLGSDPFMSI